jgi:hypothetical protein
VVSRMRMLVLAVVITTIGVFTTYAGNPSSAQVAGDIGYRDFSFAANGVSNPTGEKPQSKLWFNDGVWWGSMFDRSTEEYHIYRYDWANHIWSDTGTLIDERNTSKADTLWDGTHLYVASAGTSTTNTPHGARIMRYSYNSTTKKYTLDQGFPVNITSTGLETIVLDKDTTGKLWVTYEQNQKVYVNRSLNDDRTWGTPFVLPVNGTNVASDDISSVVAFDSQIGVMWSNQTDDAMYFATHKDDDPDNVWQGSRTAIQGTKYADDHISLRSVQAADSSGRVFAAVKTSLGDLANPDPNAPLLLLLVRDKDGNWTNHVYSRVSDNETRPIVMLDQEHRELYMFATAPCCSGGTIYYKKTSLDNISFSDGLGEPFIQGSTDQNLNDATSTKQNLSSATGLMVMASSGTVVSGTTGSEYYWHNAISLGGADNIPPETTIDSGPSGTVNDTSASFAFSSTEPDSTFECRIDAGAFQSCTSPKSYSNLSNGSHTLEVRATDGAGNTDATPASRTWTVDATVDTTAPAVQPPARSFVQNSRLDTSTIPVQLTWSATDSGGVATYQLQQSTNGGAYQNVSLPSATATTITRPLTPGNTYQFQVRAQDKTGNWSSWKPGSRFQVDAYQESASAISYVGLWSTQTLAGTYGGAQKYAKGAGTEKATFAFTGNEVAWVAPTSSNRGKADVYLDGTRVATVDLYSSSGQTRKVVFSRAGLDPSVSHTLEVRVLGTKNAASKGKRVDVDAFVVLR